MALTPLLMFIGQAEEANLHGQATSSASPGSSAWPPSSKRLLVRAAPQLSVAYQ